MEKKRLIKVIDGDGSVTYFYLNNSQCDLLEYLYTNDFLRHFEVEFDIPDPDDSIRRTHNLS